MKKRGRPLLYQTEEERKAAIRRTNAIFLRETRWYCEVCQREYSLGSKINHTNTKKTSKELLRKSTINRNIIICDFYYLKKKS